MLLVATQWGTLRRFESQSGLDCARTGALIVYTSVADA